MDISVGISPNGTERRGSWCHAPCSPCMVGGREFRYHAEGDYFSCEGKEIGSLRCGVCFCDSFRIGYGEYQCIVACTNCEHRMVAYSG